jgi:hypothetical protein
MKTIFETGAELQGFCDSQGWRACFIGGIAVQRWGQPRVTPDVDLTLRMCSAEDLVVMKLFASRAIDIRDAEGIAVKHDRTLDWRYVEEQLAPLAEAKEEPEIMQQLARMRKLSSTL